jgi:hypothetical protein
MQVYLEALLELSFHIKPPNFRVEAHMEALAGVALTCEENLEPEDLFER